MSRFDSVKYTSESIIMQEDAKALCERTEAHIELIEDGPAKSIALIKLHECYMWMGVAIRDEQVKRGSQTEQQEG